MNKNSPRHYLAVGQEVPDHVCLDVCKQHFNMARYILTAVVVEDVVADNSTAPVPEGGEARGKAILRGLGELLESPNMLPVGTGTYEVRLCITSFDRQLEQSGNRFAGVREAFVRYYYPLAFHTADQRVVAHDILGRGKKIETTFQSHHNDVVALLIFKLSMGWDLIAHRAGRLWKMGTKQEHEMNFHLIALPLLVFACTEMNPHNQLCCKTILEKNLNRLENNLCQKITQFSTWSQEEALRRIEADEIDFEDRDMCSGVEFQFARMFSLIIKDFKWKFNHDTRTAELPWITAEEKRLMYVGYDNIAVPRYGQPPYL